MNNKIKPSRKTLSLLEKVQLIESTENYRVGVRKLAEQYGIGKTQVAHILKNKNNILKIWYNNLSEDQGKFPIVNGRMVDSLLYEWYKSNGNNLATGPMLKEKAKEIAANLGMSNFKASNGWLQKFKIRHDLNTINDIVPSFSATSDNSESTNLLKPEEMCMEADNMVEQTPVSCKIECGELQYVENDQFVPWNHFLEGFSLAAMSSGKSYETLAVTVPKPFVYHVELNRPDRLNALNQAMWHEIGACFDDLAVDGNCRAIVLTGAGKLFTAGIDLNDMMSLSSELADADDVSRKAKILSTLISKYQKSLSSLETCNKPVIAAVHGPCVGAGVDMITAADIRYCTADAWFQVKEVDIGMAADVGTLQRLPKVIGSDSLVRELCFTARKLKAPEAHSCGLISKVFENKDSLVAGAIELAAQIASKSPVAVQGTKMNLVFSRDHSVQEGLDQIGNHNKMALQSEDFVNAVMGQATKNPDVVFSKL